MIPIDDVRKVTRFSELPESVQSWIAQRTVREQISRGKRVFDEGDPCDLFFYIESGAVKISRLLENGRELILDILYAGESIGEAALIDGSPYPASASAQEDTDLLVLPRTEYMKLLRDHPDAALGVIRELSFRLRALHQRLTDIGDGGVEKRLSQVLLTFARRIGVQREHGLLIPIHLTRQELADMIGARIETVIRVMSRWQKEALLNTTPDGVVLLEIPALEHIAAGRV